MSYSVQELQQVNRSDFNSTVKSPELHGQEVISFSVSTVYVPNQKQKEETFLNTELTELELTELRQLRLNSDKTN